MNPKIKCLKCGSYIHDIEHCWNWHERRMCYIGNKLRESCDCDSCKSKEICQCCNWWSMYCKCSSERCSVCNEHLKNFYGGQVVCKWDHTKPLCKFCKLPLYRFSETCTNYHIVDNSLCKECNMPEEIYGKHKHDGTLCKKCGTLLNRGKCIYKCVNGGNRCIHCYSKGVINNKCLHCYKDQTGQLTKAAIK